MKILAITKMKFKELIRTFKSSAIVFVLPIVFIGIFGIAFGGSINQISFDIAAVPDEDEKYTAFIEILDNLNKDDDSNSIFDVTIYDSRDNAINDLKNDDVQGVVELVNGKYELTLNPTDQQSSIISSIFTSVVSGFEGFNQDDFLSINQVQLDSSDESSDYTVFQFQAAGLIIYGILILIPQVAFDFVKIIDKKDIFRYFTSKVTSIEIILGHFIYLFTIGAIQLVILYTTSIMFGFGPADNSIPALFIIGLPTVAFSIGVGMLIGAFIDNPDAATNLGSMLSIILGFFSGSFINQVDQILKFNIGGSEIALTDFIPSFHASEAMRSVMLFGNDLETITSDILFLLLASFVILAIGTLVFSYKKLRFISVSV